MRLRAEGGNPWSQRIWFEEGEIDSAMDSVRLAAGTQGFSNTTGVDVEYVLEKVLGITPDYCDLPHDVMGQSIFRRDGSCRIEISRRLSDAAEKNYVERARLRSTLAHECAHVVLHARLWAASHQRLDMFADEANSEKARVLCRDGEIKSSRGTLVPYNGEWWEWQANKGMATLLLPRVEFKKALSEALKSFGVDTVLELANREMLRNLIGYLASQFDVSAQMIRIRTRELGYLRLAEKSKSYRLEV